MEHVLSGLQTCMKDAHEPYLSKMEKLNCKINESIKQVKSAIKDGDDNLQKVIIIALCLMLKCSTLKCLPFNGRELNHTFCS